ncbi:flagellar filament capping protein FliD [Shewanella colwelliana]|uniref:flagellar filament capping protein FliD n=1 Tax=Shewanella colwelliana TaxID=23 RepID=UPI00048C9C26|nr:flagellar filament capping protein FliD [Shewanella colwelliana]
MALTATGIGSGLDISNIVKVLVDAEKIPKEAIFNRTEQSIDAKVSAMGTLKSELAKFQDALEKLQSGDELNQRTVSTGDSSYLTAEASKSAQAGSYNIQVEQLAKQHKVAGINVADPALPVGDGSLQFSVNGSDFTVALDGTESLEDIAGKINNASDNVGVTATVITSDAGSRLVFTSDKSGLDNQITVTATDTSGTGLNDMFNGANLSTLQNADNAILHIDGQQVTSQSNEVKNAILGVSLNLTDADLSKTTTLKIEQDDAAVKENVKGFVESYNALMEAIDKVSSYDSEKKTAAALQGDSMIRSLESQLRGIVSERVSVDGNSSALYELGIETDRYGKMSINDTKLDSAIADNMASIEMVFSTAGTGLANRFDDIIKGYAKTGGLIDDRKNAYTADKQRLDDQRDAFKLKMEQLEARLFKQFNAMDLIVGQLNQQSAGIVSGLNSLPGVVQQQN